MTVTCLRAAGCALAALLLCSTAVLADQSAPADFAIGGGHFYTQANGAGGVDGSGFAVTDDGGVPFWATFSAYGGVAALGYPASQRFDASGFTEQVFQKAALQWNGHAVAFLNVLDVLHQAGKDGWLQATFMTPPPASTAADRGLAWPAVVARHQALLETAPALRAAYFAARDPLDQYGLPVSPVVDEGPALVVRCQRAVLQQWKTAQPWAAAGAVTIANAGDILKSSGLLPAAALLPLGPPTPPAFAPGTFTYVALGASDALGVGASSPARGYVGLLSAGLSSRLPGVQTMDLGIDGASTVQVLDQEAPRLAGLQPSLVTITVGPNDLIRSLPADQFRQELDRLLTVTHSSAPRTVLLANLPDLSFAPAVPAFLKPLAHAQVLAYNAAIAAEANAHGAVLVDLYTPSEQLLPTHPELLSSDGFHPSDAGYQLYANAFWQALQGRI